MEQTQQKPLDFEQVWLMFQELKNRQEQTEELLRKNAEEFDKRSKETDRLMRNLMKKSSEAESRWGKFVESLVEGCLIKMLKNRNIDVEVISQRVKTRYAGRQYEFDLVARNGDSVVVVEVKTTLSPSDIKEFLSEIKVFKKISPEYSDRNVYGAVAYINVDGDADVMAEKQGLFVIKATGDSAKITNKRGFKPKAW